MENNIDLTGQFVVSTDPEFNSFQGITVGDEDVVIVIKDKVLKIGNRYITKSIQEMNQPQLLFTKG